MGKYHLLLVIGVLAAALLVLLTRADPIPLEPCATVSSSPMLQAEAAQAMRDYLASAGFQAEVQIREEGSFMLGAYPRSRVLWSIRILEPALLQDDLRLQKIALSAYCLRRGWVWLNIGTSDGAHQLISYSQEALEQVLSELTAAPTPLRDEH